jgi:hypothetical protein
VPTELTDAEVRIVERYVSVLDFLSRCAQAIDGDNMHYLWDKSGQLLGAVERLHQELKRTGGKPKVRRGAVAAGVRYHGRHYQAGRLLHPPRVELTASEVGSIMLAVAGGDALLMKQEAFEAIASDAKGIAERTDVRPDQVARVLCALRTWEVRDGE